MASSAFHFFTSIATPSAVDSNHMTKGLKWHNGPMEAKADAFIATKPASPCITAGSTGSTLAGRMAAFRMKNSHPAFLKHGSDAPNSIYGSHYRNSDGEIDPRNYLILGRAKNDILHAIEEIMRGNLRSNPGQSKQQNKVTVSGNALGDPEGFGAIPGTVHLIAAPDGPRDAFLKADAEHKAARNLCQWCTDPKN